MENKLARFFRNSGPMRFFVPLGLILIIFGIVLLRNTPAQYQQTQGVITNVSAYQDEDDTLYDVDFDYTVDGKKYSSTFFGEKDTPSIGDTVTVYYNPDQPESTSNTKHTGIISIAMIAAGAVALVLSTVASLKAFRKSRELDEKAKAADVPVMEPLPKEQLTEYYVSFDGNSLKPGYIVENKSREVVYEAPMTKNAAIGNRIFTFTNHVTNETTDHEVGHTTTASYSNEFFSVRSWFKFDGKNIWDVLHDRGIRIDTDMLSKLPTIVYNVSLNGRFFATIETSGRFVHEEDAAEHKLNIPVGKYYYRCWTNETDLDLLFLTVFALSETDQAIAE